MRRTKIVATLGPATSSVEMIGGLIESGVNVFRMNFSHGTHEDHAARIAIVRAEAQRMGRPVAVLQDLQGPKIRTGKLVDGAAVQLVPGQSFIITTEPLIGTSEKVSTTYTELAEDVKPGDRMLLSDGLLEVRVHAVRGPEVHTEVVHGGMLRESQGINLPGVAVSAPAVTPKDEIDLQFGLEHDLDYVAVSFVRRAADIRAVRERIRAAGKQVPIIAKIEKPEALDELAAILNEADGVMVARGDLGVEMSPEEVPIVQKRIIEAANRVAIPVITATEMLQSMVVNPRPTRAEASDVANAIIDGTDAVMLSNETATGKYPLETVRIMARIAEVAEASGRGFRPSGAVRPREEGYDLFADDISEAACTIAANGSIRAIVAFTQSGGTARLVSHYRPAVPIFAFTPIEEIYNRLSLNWGITPILCRYVDRLDELTEQVREVLLSRGYASRGDVVVITGGHPISSRGSTNFLQLQML